MAIATGDIILTLGYSTNGGANWTEKDFIVSAYKVWKGAEQLVDPMTFWDYREVEQEDARRVFIDFTLDFQNFDEAADPDCTIYEWACAWDQAAVDKLKRIVVKEPSGVSLFGYTTFAAANTNYVVKREETNYDIEEVFVKRLVFKMMVYRAEW